ncbi:MAG: diaminopimelate dehydrogenase [Oscillospiraceae bacterium]|nr:diaminopimelate dehydrogenase [Oscillospiraceae bacterium]
MKKIRIGIIGYGNVSAGAALAIYKASDMELCAVFTRRDPKKVKLQEGSVPVLPIGEADHMTGDIDVMLLCTGSATDLPEQGPYFAKKYNIVDSYDAHEKIPEYLSKVNIAAAANKKTAIISAGWDPGLFSLMRLYSDAMLPEGETHTFWGPGVSQGHSDAIRRVDGVAHGVQYTIPVDSAVEEARGGGILKLSPKQKHKRDCFVALKPGADKDEVEEAIRHMPNYFEGYDTTVTFVEIEELFEKHSKMPHGGMVLRGGITGKSKQFMELSLRLDSNPEFTGSIMTAYARAAYRMNLEASYGAKTPLDIPPTYLSSKSRDEVIKQLL